MITENELFDLLFRINLDISIINGILSTKQINKKCPKEKEKIKEILTELRVHISKYNIK